MRFAKHVSRHLGEALVLVACIALLNIAGGPATTAQAVTMPTKCVTLIGVKPTVTRTALTLHRVTPGQSCSVVEDVVVTYKATGLPASGTVSPASIAWGGPAPRWAGCTDAQLNFRRYNNYGFLGTSTIYYTHLHIFWCFMGDAIAQVPGVRHGDIHFSWWFSSLSPGSAPRGSLMVTQYWNPMAGRPPHSSSYLKVQQQWHQCFVWQAPCITEYPFIWVSALGNGQFYWDAGH